MNRLQRLGALAGLLGVLTLSACTGEEEPPEPAPTSASSTDSSGSSPTDEPSEEPSLDGPTVAGEVASFQVPEGFEVSEFGVGIYNADQGGTRISLLEVPGVGDITVKQMVSVGLTNFGGKPEVGYDAELGGQPAYSAVGVDRAGAPRREYGAVISGSTATISFDFPRGTSQGDQDALVESVLATWSWL